MKSTDRRSLTTDAVRDERPDGTAFPCCFTVKYGSCRGHVCPDPNPRQLSFSIGAMVAAVIKLYLIGTALSVLAVFYGIVDSFGGLMYAQDCDYVVERNQQTQRELSSRSSWRGPSVTRGIGS